MRDAYDTTGFEDLGTVRPLAGWEPSERLRPQQMQRISEQALALLDGYYVHLPIKQRLYGAEPLTRLRVLRDRLDDLQPMADEEFHAELTAIFTSLRDRHTIYILPAPYREWIAFLPVLIERVVDDGVTRYLVTKVYEPIAEKAFDGEPVEVTHWNGMPIERAIALNGALNAGGNADARFARGLMRLTFRWLGLGSRPPEDWVTLTYKRGDGSEQHARCSWLLVGQSDQPLERRREIRQRREPIATSRGLDVEGEWLRGVQRQLFGRDEKWETHDERTSELIAYRQLVSNGRTYSYLRVFSFSLSDRVGLAQFEAAAREFLSRCCDGLIIDVRGNPGGDLGAAEALLAMLTDQPLEPTRLEFLTSPTTLALARRFVKVFEAEPVARAWSADLRRAVASGSDYVRSPGLPEAPIRGVAHALPKVLLIDALSYSAADAFAAGFQDNELGFVLGTAGRTGGGGGNVWDYAVVREYVGDALPPRTAGAGFEVAVRRIVRSGKWAGVGVEDIGIEIDTERPFALTSKDVLGDNSDLLGRVIGVLERA